MFSPPHDGLIDGPTDGAEQEQVQRRERRLVLLVDDCRDTRELYAEYLELSGFDVKEADDGIVAISEAVRVHPDIIVMDMSLPRLDGRGAAQQLRADERTRRIPLVLISGYDADNLPANNGLWDHYLGKPCPPEELVSVIGRLVA
jgi:two-component system, cell cycle response regulator DivK